MKNGTAPAAPPKEAKPIAKVSEKKKAELKAGKSKRDEMQEWFTARHQEMTGKCAECGCHINKGVYQFAVMSIAHLLPKRTNMFPSVATHPDNWIELCVDHHTLYDRSWDDAMQMSIWNHVVEKFIKIYPSIAPEERKHIPDVLRQEVL